MLTTIHRIHPTTALDLSAVADSSVHLVVTSPPYPMIEMWDETFTAQAPEVGDSLARDDGPAAFEAMHRLLDRVWRELPRILVPGGLACINIGDATRTLAGRFQIYPNHARILNSLVDVGLSPLPGILWRKPTNAPNKFMGSGMVPPGAYVTLEHEHVLIARNGDRRRFPDDASRQARRASAYFWEERNRWFTDVWTDLPGSRQALADPTARRRSAAFPLELPLRLLQMLSVRGDTVLDPFLGLGTTQAAALLTARSSIGYELSPELARHAATLHDDLPALSRTLTRERLESHLDFVKQREQDRGPLRHRNRPHSFPVVTRQEQDLELLTLDAITPEAGTLDTRTALEPLVHRAEHSLFTLDEAPPTLDRTRARNATPEPS